MIAIETTWIFTLDGTERRVESAYNPLTGGLALKLDGEEVKRWAGGVVQGSRVGAAHGFAIGSHEVAFDAGLTKFNRFFRLKLDGREIAPQPLDWKREAAVMLFAIVFVGAVAGAAMIFGGK